MGNIFSRGSRSSRGAPVSQEKKAAETNTGTESLQVKAESMQEVLPRIYMGPSSVAQNLEVLEKHGITHVLAIGWDLKAHFPDKFKIFLIPFFAQAFEFMDSCLSDPSSSSSSSKEEKSASNATNNQSANNRLFVHCHKGLSRSASIIIAYEMRKRQRSFESVYNDIRKTRSFIMPNIGFQVQLQTFHQCNYSLDAATYANLDIYQNISDILPTMLNVIISCQQKFASNKGVFFLKKIIYVYFKKKKKGKEVDDQELFEITMYFHQVDMLHRSGSLKNEKDVITLRDAVKRLRSIQVDYIGIDASIKRFDNLFRLDSNGNPLPPPERSKKQSGQLQVKTLSATTTTTTAVAPKVDEKEEKTVATSSTATAATTTTTATTTTMMTTATITDHLTTAVASTNTTEQQVSTKRKQSNSDPSKPEILGFFFFFFCNFCVYVCVTLCILI
ncbi:hypothetical protein RFI_26043 [Reticulomyxa filosa]|uniref:protein-tyrosine-phosphatase n=1 Tax=Reticulomyxa filosa TaxID=46433 RepID=X6MBE9_RETFI|nr:hypothetical protein RFI_26043 [Reticulomyxa filosa]|eukprot:ETO11333.1 hypothetical protein RFI_26043 [Reticulomyxa filosa]